MSNDRNIRRLQVALHSRGEGVILFSLWSGLETVLLLLSTNTLAGSLAAIPGREEPAAEWVVYGMFFVIMVLIFGGNLALNIYIGRAAIGFGHGKTVRKAPLIWCGLYTCLYIFVIPVGILLSLENGSFPLNIISCVPDVFVAVIHIQIIVFSLRLKKAEA